VSNVPLKFFKKVRENLKTDAAFRAYFEGESTLLPQFYTDIIKKDLGEFWKWLPEGAIYHDHKAYSKKKSEVAIFDEAKSRKAV